MSSYCIRSRGCHVLFMRSSESPPIGWSTSDFQPRDPERKAERSCLSSSIISISIFAQSRSLASFIVNFISFFRTLSPRFTFFYSFYFDYEINYMSASNLFCYTIKKSLETKKQEMEKRVNKRSEIWDKYIIVFSKLSLNDKLINVCSITTLQRI